MKAPVFRAYVRRSAARSNWLATIAQADDRSRYGRPSRLPIQTSTRAEAVAAAAEFAHMHQNEPPCQRCEGVGSIYFQHNQEDMTCWVCKGSGQRESS